ncbi:MAG: hypothetical protein M1827_003746 [Pycnora praestabilis]|nr:MAG: hypothetical protein M1827_003746 [Pycnora praestabilis]
MAPSLTPEEVADYSQTRQPAIIASSVVFLVLCNVSVFVRILSQLRVSRRLFVDDYAIIFAAVCSDVTGALYLNATSNGLGLHVYRVLAEDPNPPHRLIALFEALYINAVLTGPCFLSIKISLLWFYRRAFLVHQRWLAIAWWINLVYIILWAIGSTIFYILQCIPPDYYWRRTYLLFKITPPSLVHGQCNSDTAVLVALPLIFSLISDFGILVLPVVTLSRLKLRTSKKLGLLAIFSLGLLACICEIVRIWLEVTVPAFADPTYANINFVIFTFAEGNIAIAAACMPLIASQWRHVAQRVHSSRNGGSSGSTISLKPVQGSSSANAQNGSCSQGRMSEGSQESTRVDEDGIPSKVDNGIGVRNDIDVEWGRMEPRG